MLRDTVLKRALALVACLGIACLVAPGVRAAEPLDPSEAEAIRDFVSGALEELGAPGAAVVIVRSDGVAFAEGFGTADSDGREVTPQTPFHVASLSKQLTSIAVMQLVTSGNLDLDGSVRSYIDWFGADDSEPASITVRDLVAQTSGLSESQGLTNRIDDDVADDALERNVRRIASEGPQGTIGQFEYSNANYDVLGYLIAVVSGESYDGYMSEHVLRPLQMTNTHLTDAAARADGVADGHYPFFGLPIRYDIPFARGSVPSSFVAASAEDLAHVLIAHLNGGAYEGTHVLDATSMADLRQPLINPNPWDGYGWGWWTYPLWDAGELTDGAESSSYSVPVMLEHGGSHATFASGMVLLPEEDIGIVVLMNMNDENAPSRFYQVHPGIAQILLGRDAPALVSYDDALAQYGKLIGLSWVALLAAFVAWSVRRYRRWHRDPGSAPRGSWAVARHLVLPLAIVVAQLVAFWLLVFSRGASLSDVPRLTVLSPDLGLIVVVVTLVSLAWLLVGAVWAFRVVRSLSETPA